MKTPFGDIEVLDAHAHFFSYKFFLPLAEQLKLSGGDPVEGLKEKLPRWELPEKDPVLLGTRWVKELDKHGVSRTVLITSVPGDEDSTSAAVKAFPDRFIGYVMIDPTREGVRERIHRSFAELGLKGVTLFPAMHHFHVYDDRVYSICEEARRFGTTVFVHFGLLRIGIRDLLGLPSKFDLRYSNPIDLHKIALDFPDVNFVVPHFGCGYFREILMVADLCKNVHVDTSSSNSWIKFLPSTNLTLEGVFKKTLDVLGPSRILFGTDSTFFPRGWRSDIFNEQVKIVHSLGVTKEDAEKIFGGNLRHILKI
ncbi:MAG: amidohydrolase family protein [Candidatus Tectomicrobia bacterium]|nr:amidohydrolase family protein [Candidatus Tectomicrobia bacterium]